VLIPGAFCTASVMNRLGAALERRGHTICVPPSFPYYLSALANTCRLPRAARDFLAWLDALGRREGFDQVDCAGHSNGGLIAMLAQDMVDAGEASCSVRVRRVITMAAPLGGFPAARALSAILPCCHDIAADSATLDRVHGACRLLAACLVAGGDFLVPPVHQYVDGVARTVMEGFQHMDFIVGTPEKVERTADEVMRWLSNSS
jgi:pimeloyl-ACP methyl ester carboxylesterase